MRRAFCVAWSGTLTKLARAEGELAIDPKRRRDLGGNIIGWSLPCRLTWARSDLLAVAEGSDVTTRLGEIPRPLPGAVCDSRWRDSIKCELPGLRDRANGKRFEH